MSDLSFHFHCVPESQIAQQASFLLLHLFSFILQFSFDQRYVYSPLEATKYHTLAAHWSLEIMYMPCLANYFFLNIHSIPFAHFLISEIRTSWFIHHFLFWISIWDDQMLWIDSFKLFWIEPHQTFLAQRYKQKPIVVDVLHSVVDIS